MAGLYGAPAYLIETPDFETKPSGLMVAATVLAMPDEHFRNGVRFRAPDCGNVSQFHDNCDIPSDPSPKLPTFHNPGEVDPVRGWDFYSYYDCRNGPGGAIDLPTETLQGFERGLPQALEVAFWTDVLATGASVVLNVDSTTANAFCVTGGVAALESYMATNFAGQATFHADRVVAPYAKRDRQIVGKSIQDGLTTILGSKWAFYGGDPNTSPAGVAAPAGYAWIYATSQVTLWYSGVDSFPNDVDQQWRYGPSLTTGPTNVPTAIAEQHWTPSNFCVQAAALVQLTC